MAIGVLSVVMVVLRQRFPAGALLMLAGAAYVWVRSTFRYRLFPDALVVERDGEPPIDVPLKSFERGEASPGVTLRGLVDVELPAVEQLRPFCVLINRVMAERQALVDEQKALARVAGPLGEWLNATWRPRDVEVPASVEVLKFEKDEGPVRMVAGSESKSSKGAALVLDRGLLFVPQRAQSRVREILFETAWIDLLTEERVPLGRVPKQLFIDRLEALRGLAEVRWLAEIRLDPDQRQVVLPDGTLSLKR
ncbi:MAG: hypothetical protein Q8K32_03820 [Archangium sp.]|nr:hypothetical protein [Archangium sp.]